MSIVEFRLEDGSTVLIEADEARGGPVMRGGRGPELVTKADETFEAALGRIGPASSALVEKFRALAQQPDEVEIEFGVKLNAEAGVIIARTSGEANFRVAVRWRR